MALAAEPVGVSLIPELSWQREPTLLSCSCTSTHAFWCTVGLMHTHTHTEINVVEFGAEYNLVVFSITM